MKVFMTKPVARFARKERISNAALFRAAADIVAGRIDADLGGGVIKQRVARAGAGTSGGYRTIVLFRAGSDVFFVYGFAKSSRASISRDELEAFRKLADRVLAFGAAEITMAGAAGELISVESNDGEQGEE